MNQFFLLAVFENLIDFDALCAILFASLFSLRGISSRLISVNLFNKFITRLVSVSKWGFFTR